MIITSEKDLKMEMNPLHKSGGGGIYERKAGNDEEMQDRLPLLGVPKQPGIVYSPGNNLSFFPNKRHILTFDPAKVRSIVACLFSQDMTVCYNSLIWAYHFSFVGYSIILMLILGYNAFPDGEFGDGKACASGQNIDMCQLDDVLTKGKDDFFFLIGFILAGYVGSVVASWLLRRKNYAALCGKTREMNMLINCYCEGLPQEKEVRALLSRWTMLAFELAVLKGQGDIDKTEGRIYLERTGLLMEGEYENLVPGDRHTTVFFWIMTKIKRLEKEGLNAKYIIQMNDAVIAMRGQANDLMSCLNRDNPFPYVALCGLLVKVNLFIMSTWKGVTWAIWLRSFELYGLLCKPKWWLDVIILLAWNVSYGGLYDLGYMLHNPFRDRKIDVAHDAIGGGLRRLSVELATGSKHIPPSMDNNGRKHPYLGLQ